MVLPFQPPTDPGFPPQQPFPIPQAQGGGLPFGLNLPNPMAQGNPLAGIAGPLSQGQQPPFPPMGPPQESDPFMSMLGGAHPDSPALEYIMNSIFSNDPTIDAPDTKPKKPKRKKPSLEEIQHKADDVITFWEPRDLRMDEDYILYRLTESGEGDGEQVTKNTPAVVVDKAAKMIAKQTPTISMQGYTADAHDAAQKTENFLRWSWERWNRGWRRSQFQPSFRYAMAHYLCLRGWMTARIVYDDEWEEQSNTTPVTLKLYDPRMVYPFPGGKNGPLYVVMKYWTTYGELKSEWEEAAKTYADEDDTDLVEVTEYYDDWYHCLYVEDDIIKPVEEHGYGFVPWIIATGNGSPIRVTPKDQMHWTRDVGVSIFHNLKGSYKQLNRLLSQLATQAAAAANPTLLYYYDPLQNHAPQPIDTNPGTTNFLFYDRERVDTLNLSPKPMDVSPVIDALIDDMNRGSLHPVLWGQGGTQSGMGLSFMSDAARDELTLVVESMEYAISDANEYALTLIRDHHDGEIGFWVTTTSGQKEGGVTITAEDIGLSGVENEVKYRDISPQDRAQMAQLAVMLNDKKLLDKETLREDWLGYDNPAQINQRVLAESVYEDPELLELGLVPAAVYQEMGADFAQFFLQMKMQKIMGAGQPQQQPQQQPQAPPGMPGMPPDMGLPPGVVAPIAQPSANPMLQALGSTIGGLGAGPPPGIPGLGGQFPPPSPQLPIGL